MTRCIGLDWRILSHRVLCYVLGGLSLAIIYCLCFEERGNSVLFIGDLPGFYAQGRIVLEGNGNRLYDIEYQRVIQNSFWPGLNGQVLPTMYPPIVGVVMACLAWLPPLAVRGILTGGSLIVLCILLVTSAHTKRVERVTLLLASMPVFLGLIGTQNTTLSLALLVLCRQFLAKERPVMAGLFAGLLFYKPQLGLLISCVLLPALGVRFAATLVGVILVQYLIGVWVCHGEWLVPWIGAMRGFAGERFSVDGYQMTAITRGVYPYILGGTFAKIWEVGLCGLAVAYVAVRGYLYRGVPVQQERLFTRFLAVFPLFTPQIMFYDMGISIFFILSHLYLIGRRKMYLAVAFVATINLCTLVRSETLSLVPVASLILCIMLLVSGQGSDSELSR